jgi:hypothetical protein
MADVAQLFDKGVLATVGASGPAAFSPHRAAQHAIFVYLKKPDVRCCVQHELARKERIYAEEGGRARSRSRLGR